MVRGKGKEKRNPANPCNGEGSSVPVEISSDGESMENDVYVISDSTISSSSEDDEDFVGKGKGKARGRGRGRAKGKASAQKQGAAKPKTPDSKPAKRRRFANMDLRDAVEDGSDDSSDSEFVLPEESLTSDDDSGSDYISTRVTPKRNLGGRNRPGGALPGDADFIPVGRPRKNSRASDGAQGKANGKGPKGKARGGKGKLNLEPEKKLGWEISDDEWENVWGEATDADFDTIKSGKLPMEQREPPKELLMPLLPFQKEWLAWSLKQEAGPMKGGILADEMGMGKTIQAISLVVAGRALNQSAPKLDLNRTLAASSSNGAQNSNDLVKVLPQVKATLVVCPLVAVIQWRNEVNRFTLNGSVNVLVYHGPRRNIGLAELAKYDIILTTYSIVELEHRKHVMPPKDVCHWCRRHFYPDRMRIHLRYFCGPDAKRTAKQAKQEKRRAVPGTFEGDNEDGDDSEEYPKGKSVGAEYDDDFEEDPKGKKKGKGATKGKNARKGKLPPLAANGERRGRKRKIGGEELSNALESAVDEFREGLAKASSSGTAKGNSVLHSVRWGRIILDEAHSIKDRRCSTAKAIFALQSEYKWALSGTPLQNRVGELYSLVRFLGIHPFSFYFCRKCECKSLDYQFGAPAEKCECGHSPLLHFCWWNKFVANPIKRWGYVNDGRRAMMLLKHKVLSNILLRRTKLERAADLALPPRTAFLRRDAFDSREDDFYQALYTQSQSQFNTYVSAGTLVNNYAHIFDLLTRLRQAVDHPYLVVYSATASKGAPSFESAAADDLCGLCHESAEDPVTTGCHHNFCRSCIQGYIDAAQDLTSQCPKCQKPLTVDFTGKSVANGKDSAIERSYKRKSILNRIDLRQFKTSTKIEAVREEIYLMLQKDSAAKAIIFSQFTSMLDLIGFALEQSGIKFVKLDGSMSMAARDQMIEAFTKDADTKIFLMSLKAGGVALNLTVASHVFLMDPWWNPAVEQQAQDRIHRLGQFKPIRVIRFVIENTIEERILKLQEKKQLVFEGTVGGSSEALGRLTEEDLRFLFTS